MSRIPAQFVLAYVPVIQRAYLDFFARYPDALTVYVLGEEILAKFPWLRKDLRALTPAEAATGLWALFDRQGLHLPVAVLEMAELTELASEPARFVLPNEEISHHLATEFLAGREVEFADVFLRWDRLKTLASQPVTADHHLPVTGPDWLKWSNRWLRQAGELASHSHDWWRQVGAVLVKDGQLLLSAVNHHVPDQYQILYQGDPRGNFKKGEHIELSTALHAEAALIAQAAQRGVALAGSELYVTTFPCPHCAKLIAYSGIRTVYYHQGYALLDGEQIMRQRQVKLVQLVE